MAGLESILRIKYDDDAVDRGLDVLQQKAVQVNDRLGALATVGTGAFLAMGSVLKDVLAPVFEKLKEFAAEFAVGVVESSEKLSTLKTQFEGLSTVAKNAIAQGIDEVNISEINVKMAKITEAIVKPFHLVGKAIGLGIIGEFDALRTIADTAGELLGLHIAAGAKKILSRFFDETAEAIITMNEGLQHPGYRDAMRRAGENPSDTVRRGISDRIMRRGEASRAQIDLDRDRETARLMERMSKALEDLNDTINDRGEAGWAAPGFQDNNVF